MQFYTNVQQFGSDLLVRGYDESGRRVKSRVDYQPRLFVRKKGGPFRTLDGHEVDSINFPSIHDAREFQDQYSDVEGMPIYGMNDWVYTYINDTWPAEVPYKQNLIRVGALDIEVDSRGGFAKVESASKEITAITLSVGQNLYAWALRDFDVPGVTCTVCKNEKDLLVRFMTFWKGPECDLDILTGWNIEGFDVPYIINRLKIVLGDAAAKMFSPWGRIRERKYEGKFGKEIQTYVISGLSVLDYLPLYQKFTYVQQPSYKLDDIGQVELGESKVDYSEYGSLADLYDQNHQLFMEYNVKDVRLVMLLEKKLGFISQACAIAYDAHININDALTSVLLWDVICHNYLMSKGIVVPRKKVNRKDEPIVGAHVKDPIPGKYPWVVSFDLTSLYPHLIMQYNISPEAFEKRVEIGDGYTPGHDVSIKQYVTAMIDGTYASEVKKISDGGRLAVAGNGALFRKDKLGFLPILMQKMFEDRKAAKDRMLAAQQRVQDAKKAGQTPSPDDEDEVIKMNNLQMAKKICLNSCYGALSNVGFRFYDLFLAEAITMSGQVAIRWAEEAMNRELNRICKSDKHDFVIASDTDSLYMSLGPVVDRIFPGDKPEDLKVVRALDKFAATVMQKAIDAAYKDLAEYTSAYAQKMFMKREAISSVGLWTAKKRYILVLYNNEGVEYAEPKIKYMGVDAARSSTPKKVKEAFVDSFKIILTGTEQQLHQYVASFREKFFKLPFHEIGKATSVQGFAKFQTENDKGIQFHVRGAMVYNRLLREKNIDQRYERVTDGDKIKLVYLKMPNPARQNVIGSPGPLPSEFGLDGYIDYETQFVNVFVGPLENIITVLGWKAEAYGSLDSFFS